MTKPLVIITGASSDIGMSTAKAFAREGHPLLLISRHIEPLSELDSSNIIYEKADVSDYEPIEKAIRKTEERYGITECLVNNAGIIDSETLRMLNKKVTHEKLTLISKEP